jgi:ferredoxin
MEGLAELAAQNLTHEVWSLIGEKGGLAGCFACLSCANCSLVCPTCYCYEVIDTPDVSLKSGVRMREVDSCQLLEYSLVALRQNFRPDRKDRTRNWMMCKFGGAGGQQETSCVGCGRCIKACPAHIDLTEVARSLWGE